jgi:hypothetical protein
MKLLFQFPGMGFFDCGGVRLMLSAPETAGERHNSVVYFKVADIPHVRKTARLRSRRKNQHRNGRR